MPAETDAFEAFRLIREGGLATGTAWEKAHEITQLHEGTAIYDAIHALLHRIEGDNGNAAYWDRRAGTNFGGDGREAELAALESMAKA